MEAVNGVSEVDKGGPPPPSPLTGCYLLIVIGEPHSSEHKDIILQRVAKGLLSWDLNDCLVDLEKELAIITEQALEGEEARYGERLIQFASENLVTEILIHPVVSTLSQCVRNLLSSFTRHRHIIHAGYTFAVNGSWALQDGTFSLADFAEAFQEIEVQRVIRAYENGISLDIHCAPEGDWTRLPKESFARSCKVRINPNDVLSTGSPSITSFISYISPFLISTNLENLLESSDVVGNIRFSRPTLYVFPGGQGDAALFGINGFNMLLDGGFSRKACFWDFVRHLDRLDAVLMTRLNNSNVNGISAVLRRKKQDAVYPQIGHFFCNLQERKAILSPDGDKDKDPLLINLMEEGQEIISNLRHLNLTPQVCYRDSEPINLYHKVGHGTLDMYVLSPAKESKEVREFLQKWNTSDQKLFANQKSSREFTFPLQNLVSICALLVWQPANPNDTITRILFPGSSPQKKIFEGLDRLKSLEFIKHAVCSEKSLAPATIVKSKTIKESLMMDRVLLKDKKPTENKLIENNLKNGDLNGIIDKPTVEKTVKKSDSTDSEKSVKKEIKKSDDGKILENGDKVEKPKIKPKVDTKTTRARAESQPRKKVIDKKASPTTPKKTTDNKSNDDVKDVKKLIGKPSPTGTPAKSTKDANNRKVIESKIKSAPKKDVAPKAASEPKPKVERKPISRRPKAKLPVSPVKKLNGVQKPDSISRKGKLDKEGTTDSSTVSTPSAEQESILKKDISKLTPEELQQLKAQELADLKEEQEAVKEIEAVFRKSEVKTDESSNLRQIKDLSIDDKLEPEEYLIIEKEEIEHDSLDDKKAGKEDETQKHARDSEESEKQRKLSGEIEAKQEEAHSDEKHTDVKEEVVDDSIIKPTSIEPSKETTAASPEEKVDMSSDKKLEEGEVPQESQPDEKCSANVESGATTTAPTLPEDERIPLDEIKEDNGQVVVEKHVKEETKEKEIPVIQLPPKSFENIGKLPPVVGIRLDKQSHIRDIVKTPDEVADLPVHEEVDYEYTQELKTTEVATVNEKTEEIKTVVTEKEIEESTKITKTVKEIANLIEKPLEEIKDSETDNDKIAENKQTEDGKVHTDPVLKAEETPVDSVAKSSGTEKELTKSPDEEKDTDEHEQKIVMAFDNKIQAELEKSDNKEHVLKTEKDETNTNQEKGQLEAAEENVDKIIAEAGHTKTRSSVDLQEDNRVLDEIRETAISPEKKVELDITNKENKVEKIVTDNQELTEDKIDHHEETTKHTADTVQVIPDVVKAGESDKPSVKEVSAPTSVTKVETDVKKEKETKEIKEVAIKTETKTEVTSKLNTDNKEMQQEQTEVHDSRKQSKEVEKIDEELTDKNREDEDEPKIEKDFITTEKDLVGNIESAIVDKHQKTETPVDDKKDSDEKPESSGKIYKEEESVEESLKDMETDKKINVDKMQTVKDDVSHLSRLDGKLQELKDAASLESVDIQFDHKLEKLQHAEPVIITDSTPETPEVEEKFPIDFVDKIELGRKSPKEREEDVIKIVTKVAEVLKSDAPLEEFKDKIPFTTAFEPFTTTYTTELRETHITTVDSPITENKVIKTDDIHTIPEEPICPKTSSTTFLEEERKIAPVHMDAADEKKSSDQKRSSLIKESQELMMATSKIISDIKSSKSDDPIDNDTEAGIVHRMLVTASSEDGGEETEICPPGTIIFSRSSESSGRSSPDIQSQKQSQKSSIVETLSDSLATIKQVKDAPEEKDSGIDELKSETETEAKDLQDGKKVVKTDDLADGSRKSTPDIQDDLKSDITKDTKEDQIDVSSVTQKSPTIEIEEIMNHVPDDKPSGDHPKDLTLGSADSKSPVDLSGKSTPEIKVSSDEVDEKLLDEKEPKSPVDLSGKSTPDIKISDSNVGDKKHSIDLSDKSTPEKNILEAKRDSPSIPHSLSGRSTPEIQIEDFDTETKQVVSLLEDATETSPLILSGKSTPETTDVIKSGKSSPEVLVSKPVEPETNFKPSEAKSDIETHLDSQEKTEDVKETHDAHDIIEPSPKSSGKSTPEIKDLKSVKPSEDASGKHTPEKLVKEEDNVDNEKIIKKDISSVESSPKKDDKNSDVTKSVIQETHTELSEHKLDFDDHPDKVVGIKETSVLDSSPKVVLSGKSTPESSDAGKQVKPSSDKSGKSTPDTGVDKHDLEVKVESKVILTESSPKKETSDMTKSVILETNIKPNEPKSDFDDNAEKVIVSSAHDIEKTFEDLSDMTKSVVFEKCEDPEEKLEKEAEDFLEKSATDLNETFETVADMCKSVSFDKCLSPPATKKTFDEFSDVSKSVVLEKCEDSEKKFEKEAEEFLQKSATDLNETFETVADMCKSMSFDKCESSLVKHEKEAEEVLEKSANDINETFEEVSDMSKSVLFDKCEKQVEKTPLSLAAVVNGLDEASEDSTPHVKDALESLVEMSTSVVLENCEPIEDALELNKATKVVEETAEDINEAFDTVTDMSKSVVFEKCEKHDDTTPTDSKEIELEDETKDLTEELEKTVEKTVGTAVEKTTSLFAKFEKFVSDEISEIKEVFTKSSDRKDSLKSVPDTKTSSDHSEHSTPEHQMHSVEVQEPLLDKSEIKDVAAAPGLKTNEQALSKLDVDHSHEKKLSVSDVEITFEPKQDEPKEDVVSEIDSKTVCASLIEAEKSLYSLETSNKVPVKTEASDTKDDASKILETTVTTTAVPIPDKAENKTGELSVAGPSSTQQDSTKLTTDETHLSGKSTPDIAEVEKQKEIEDTLRHEKHIPGSSTPPTVPVSPVIRDTHHQELKTEIKKVITESSMVASIKEYDLRSSTPGSDDYEVVTSTHSDISSGQVSRAPNVLESEQSDEEDDVPGSPMSITSQVAHSRSSSHYDFDEDANRITTSVTKPDPMNMSMYGALPDDSTTKETMDEPQPTYLYEITKAKFSTSTSDDDGNANVDGNLQIDQINKNGHQPPKAESSTSMLHKEDDVMMASFIGTELPSADKKDPIESWGKPLGLPSPAPPSENKGTPKKEKKLPAAVSAKNKLNDDKKRSESPSKYRNKKSNAIYVDLTYVPHHGNAYYSYVDFFKRIRARYYVFSGIEPSREVYNALLEAKQTWEDKELEVTIIPTYDTDILGYWVAENEELLSKYKIDLSPSASRCTINLQDHETSCSAYRLEF